MIDLLAQPDCHDIAWGWIQTLFGTNGKCEITNAANVNTPYANAFSVLTAALAFLGGLFMAYHTVLGIVSSAYTGKVLGERWHQIWAPLRVVLGFGLLVPVGDGFSSIHYVLRDVVAVSAIQLANGVIGTYVGSVAKDALTSTNAKVNTLGGGEMAQKFFEKELCSAIITAMPAGGFMSYSYNAPSPSAPDTTWGVRITQKGQIWDYGACGKLSLEDYEPGANTGIFSTEGSRKAIDVFNNAKAKANEELRTKLKSKDFMDYSTFATFINLNGDAISYADAASIAKLRSDKTVPAGIQDKLNQYADAWNKDVGAAASKIFTEVSKDKRSNLAEQIKYNGFMAAGAMERSLSAVSGVVSGIANTQVSETKPAMDEDTMELLKFAQSLVIASKASDSSGDSSGGTDDTTSAVNAAIGALLPDNVGNMFTGKASPDPVGDMIVFGNNLLATASYALLFIWGAKSVADGFGNSFAGLFGGGAVSSLADSISRWFSWFIMIMIIVGLMHSFVLPLLPMIMVFTMGMQWLIMFLEGSIAAVLWAFVFIRMDGTEFLDQKQSPGAGLLFNLLLRPALGMLAFCGMLILLPALLNTLTLVWSGAYYMATGDHVSDNTYLGTARNALSFVWLWQWLASMVMFCWMQWTMTLRIAGLIPSISDRVGHWMGLNSTSGYGDQAETGANIGAIIAATQAISKAPIQPTGGAGGGKPPGGGGGGDKPGMPSPQIPGKNGIPGGGMGKNGAPKRPR